MTIGSQPVPYWMSDPDYYGTKDPRRKTHLERIKLNQLTDSLTAAAVADGSYSVQVRAK